MRNPRFITILAWSNIVVIALLFTDTFFKQTDILCETFAESSHEHTLNHTGLRHRTDYYIATESGRSYNVPEELYINLNHERGSFCITKSGFFNRNLFMSSYFEGKEYKVKTGFLNETYLGIVLAAVAFLFSLLNLTARPMLIRPPYSYGMVFFASMLTIIIVICYFGA